MSDFISENVIDPSLYKHIDQLWSPLKQQIWCFRDKPTKTLSVTVRIVTYDVSEPVDDDPDKVLSLVLDLLQGDCCMCLCFSPTSCCFLRFVQACFPLDILLLNLLFMYKAGMFICEQAVKHLKNFIPTETLTG